MTFGFVWPLGHLGPLGAEEDSWDAFHGPASAFAPQPSQTMYLGCLSFRCLTIVPVWVCSITLHVYGGYRGEKGGCSYEIIWWMIPRCQPMSFLHRSRPIKKRPALHWWPAAPVIQFYLGPEYDMKNCNPSPTDETYLAFQGSSSASSGSFRSPRVRARSRCLSGV